jgi:Fe-S-cluster containining protein
MKYTLDNFGKDKTQLDYSNPNCVDCNECCMMMVALTRYEFESILYRIRHDKELESKLIHTIIEYKNKLIYQNTVIWNCIFSDKDKKCMIYDIRPQICKNYHCSKKNDVDVSKYPEHLIIMDIFNDIANNILNKSGLYINEYLKMMAAYKYSFKVYMENQLK